MKPITILGLLIILVPTSAVTNEKRDQADVVRPIPETGEKCGQCPCVNPCSQQQQQLPPPPPPPAMTTQYYPPPPPRFYYFSGPAQQTQITPPGPPPPRFNYAIGTPGNSNLYSTDPFNLEIYNGAASYQCNILQGSILVICGLLQILVFYTT